MASPPSATSAASSPIDAMFLQNLMSRMQLQPPYPRGDSLISDSLDDLLLAHLLGADPGAAESGSDESDSEVDLDKDRRRRRALHREEARLEREIVRIVASSGDAATELKANTGHSVAIGDHNVCVGFHEDGTGEYRVWEWHGHVMLFDDDEGYSAEYIYGNHFEKLSDDGKMKKSAPSAPKGRKPAKTADAKEKDASSGLLDLITGSRETSAGNGRILHRNSICTTAAKASSSSTASPEPSR